MNCLKADTDSDNFYEVKIHIKDILKKYFKEVFILLDTQNELLCSELYLKMHKIENKLRNAVNIYMLGEFGVGWFKKNIKPIFRDKSNKYSNWYNKKYNDFNNVQSALFNLQTNDLIEMLQKSYIDQLNKDQVDKIMNLKDVLGQQADLVLNESYMNLQSIWDMEIKEIYQRTLVQLGKNLLI